MLLKDLDLAQVDLLNLLVLLFQDAQMLFLLPHLLLIYVVLVVHLVLKSLFLLATSSSIAFDSFSYFLSCYFIFSARYKFLTLSSSLLSWTLCSFSVNFILIAK